MLSSPGSAVPRAGSPVLQGKLVLPSSLVALGEAGSCVWQPAEIISDSLLGKDSQRPR